MLQRSPTYFRTGRNAIDSPRRCGSCRLAENGSRDRAAQDLFVRTIHRAPLANRSGKQGCLAHSAPRSAPIRYRHAFHAALSALAQRIAFVPDADRPEHQSGRASVVNRRDRSVTEAASLG